MIAVQDRSMKKQLKKLLFQLSKDTIVSASTLLLLFGISEQKSMSYCIIDLK